MDKSQITNHKPQTNHKLQITNWSLVFACNLVFVIWCLAIPLFAISSTFAQEGELEFTLDVNAGTIPLPKIFKPNVDLSGRGLHKEITWPQGAAAKVTLDTWQKDIGFSGVYRLQYNLWEINGLAKDKNSQEELLTNYENIIKNINNSQGLVILDIFSTPAGLGKALDKKSVPWDLKAFKALVKQTIETLSCHRRYNIWYEVWSTPDSNDFYLGRKQEYLNLYRAVAEAINELEAEYKVHIPVGGPSTSWWFQNLDGNSIVTPERSLIYELIKFCYSYRLPLDFVSWHGYSTDPKTEKEITAYRKIGIALIRDWLSYFHFEKENIPLMVDEWNYDSGDNILAQRHENSNVAASYIISRMKQMYESGLDYQIYYSLEDFQNNKEGVARNVGVFWFDKEGAEYKRGPKSIYNVFRMIRKLDKEMMTPTPKSSSGEFVDIVATKGKESFAIIVYSYGDPRIAMDYISRNIASLNDAERKIILNNVKSKKLEEIIKRRLDITKMRFTKRIKALLKKAQELDAAAEKYSASQHTVKINIKNLKGDFLYQRYAVDSSCSLNCDFVPAEEKEVNAQDGHQETLSLKPYSVNMIILKKKPIEPEALPPPAIVSQPAAVQSSENQDTLTQNTVNEVRQDSPPAHQEQGK